MKNLAYDKTHTSEINRIVLKELRDAGIAVVTHQEILPGEVPTRLSGKLGEITFTRYWYYWVVKGSVPLEVARLLYASPIGARDVRVAGHCGCPPPEEWAELRTKEGQRILLDPNGGNQRDWEAMQKIFPNLAKEVPLFVKSREDLPEGYVESVDTYHIDSEDGLKLFATVIKGEGLA